MTKYEDEPAEMNGTDETTGYPWVMRRNHGGAWCGYVYVPKENKLFGKGYDEIIKFPANFDWKSTKIDQIGIMNVFSLSDKFDEENKEAPLSLLARCHGGLTYADKPWWDKESDTWVFGFDCSHCDDFQPKSQYTYSMAGIYRDAEYVQECIKTLASDLKLFGEL